MLTCPTCSTPIRRDDETSCPACGTELSSGSRSSDPTLLESATRRFSNPSVRAPRRKAQTAQQSAITSHESLDGARFVPGTMLAARYRIVGLLGRGGMGEVYRADDLKLGQTVALKFLPEALASDGAALARFHREVRVARQVSHRNVCRVYDIGEVEGLNFLSMEYIKGEELSSLLKRIGRLPHDKALEIARQLCAGLSAAHDNGVLHRDLKPANVMLDGEGNVRILDFGLAGLSEEFREDELHAGTPAYMAPEQLAGAEVSKQSDIYALGLVLYEIFTGKRAYEAKSLGDLIRMRQESTPTNPSHLVKEIDPLVERAILRCLENEAKERPATALQVAAMLPGGDPLAAALAAGETPSPEMVAAAPTEGVLRRPVALTLLASMLVILGLVCFFSKNAYLYRFVPLEKSPEVLKERGSEITKRLGYTDAPTDTAFGKNIDMGYLQHVRQTDTSLNVWERLRKGQPAAIYFWYRQSPRYLDTESQRPPAQNDPPTLVSGMRGLTLDPRGRLRSFYAVPPQRSAPAPQSQTPDWSVLFAEAGLNPALFQETESTWIPQHPYDTRVAWDGVYPEQPDLKMHIEAASFEGKPVYFEIVDVWDKPSGQAAPAESNISRAQLILLLAVFLTVLVGSILLALKNLQLGRGDRKGAFRVAMFLFAVLFIGWVFDAHHIPTAEEVFLLVYNLQWIGFWSAFVWLTYIALEPFVRRRWPSLIIGWSRLLAGGYRDPLVGRDILIGTLFGVALILTQEFSHIIPRWFGITPGIPFIDEGATTLLGIRYIATSLSFQIFACILMSFVYLFFLLLLYIIFRRKWLAALIGWLIAALAVGLGAASVGLPLISWVMMGLFSLLHITAIFRYGLLTLISASFVFHLSIFYPITSEFSAWYAGDFVVGMIVTLALAVGSFYVSLGGQKLLGDGPFKD